MEWLADRSLVGPDELDGLDDARPSRHAAAEPALAGFPPAPVTDDLSVPAKPVPYRRRRTDDEAEGPGPDPDEARTAQRPAVAPPPPEPDPAPRTQPGATGDGFVRVSDLLAENGGQPPPESRRRRRYRDEDEPDDVLARVLRQQ
jgi:hypothetical protein